MTDHDPAEAAANELELTFNTRHMGDTCSGLDADEMADIIRDAYATQAAELATAKAEVATLREALLRVRQKAYGPYSHANALEQIKQIAAETTKGGA